MTKKYLVCENNIPLQWLAEDAAFQAFEAKYLRDNASWIVSVQSRRCGSVTVVTFQDSEHFKASNGTAQDAIDFCKTLGILPLRKAA